MLRVKFHISFILLFSVFNSAAETIRVAADYWCPFNCQPQSAAPGFMIEIAQQVFSQQGHQLEYLQLPWPRAISEARRGKINAIVGAFTGDAPDFIFPENELALISNVFFTRAQSQWHYQDISSLETITLGAIVDYDYGPWLNDYLEKHKHTNKVELLSGKNSPLKRGIKMLQKGRIEAFVEAEPVFWYTTNKMAIAEQFKKAGIASEPSKVFIAFSPAVAQSHHYAKILSEGIKAMRESGQLQKILAKYGLKDWQ
jgi:polar amino acid transport system substrate-binding protein